MGWDRWTWSVFGKHPSARDYFQTPLSSPLTRAFARWVDDGFHKAPEAGRCKGMVAWRFWARGTKRKSLICGLAKSSGDGVGRPYPLVIMGEGRLDQWEQYWHLLPFALDATWGRLEYLAARRVAHIGQFESDLQCLPRPTVGWKQLQARVFRDPRSEEMRRKVMEEIQKQTCTILAEEKLIIPLRHQGHEDQLQMAGVWNRVLKTQCTVSPSTVFIGGSPEKTFIVFFSRPLIADDFVELWSVRETTI